MGFLNDRHGMMLMGRTPPGTCPMCAIKHDPEQPHNRDSLTFQYKFYDEHVFNDEELAAHAKHLTTQAKVPHRWEFRHDYVGYNYRMPNINAALGCAQLENLDKFIASKRQLALEYAEYFKNVGDLQFFTEPEDTFSNYWLQAVILKDKVAQQDFLQQTNDNGVMTRPIWELMNRLPMFEHCQNDGLENTIWFADRVVNIPSSVRL